MIIYQILNIKSIKKELSQFDSLKSILDNNNFSTDLGLIIDQVPILKG